MPPRKSVPCPKDLEPIYNCLGDETRRRILFLLLQGPLKVGQIEEAISLRQAFVSRHLAYLRRHGLVRAERRGNWVVYSLPGPMSAELEANLRCLEECARGHRVYQEDLRALGRMMVADEEDG